MLASFLGCLRDARFCCVAWCCEYLPPCGRTNSPSGGVWDACAACDFAFPAELGTPARRAARRGRLWGCAPFSAPLASPRSTPLKVFSFPKAARATRLLLRELPSLAQVISLRAALMPEDAFALNVNPFQPDPTNIIDSFWVTFTFFSVALNILTSPRADKFRQQTNICPTLTSY